MTNGTFDRSKMQDGEKPAISNGLLIWHQMSDRTRTPAGEKPAISSGLLIHILCIWNEYLE